MNLGSPSSVVTSQTEVNGFSSIRSAQSTTDLVLLSEDAGLSRYCFRGAGQCEQVVSQDRPLFGPVSESLEHHRLEAANRVRCR